MLMLDGPSPLLGGANVRLYAPFRELDNAFVRGQAEFEASTRAFDDALRAHWAILGLLSPVGYRWLIDSERAERFLQAMITYWPVLEAVGLRYTLGGQVGEALWALPHKLHFVLARRGVPRPRLSQPLPAGGVAALLPPRN